MSDIAIDIARQAEKLKVRLDGVDRPVVAIAMARDEADIIERFVRHTNCWADALLIVDHASIDGTSTILRQLAEEGLALGVARDDAPGKHHSDRITLLAKAAAIQLNAHIVVPLDADEFLIDEQGNSARSQLLAQSPDNVSYAKWRSYIPTPLDDAGELDIFKRIGHRLVRESAGITKMIIGGALARRSDFRVGYGSHWLFTNASHAVPPAASPFHLAHFPVRSPGQITAKVLITPLAGMLDAERPVSAQEHYRWLRSICPVHSYMSPRDLQTAAEQYALDRKSDPPDLLFDPIKCTSGSLRYTHAVTVDAAFRLEQFVRSMPAIKNTGADNNNPTALRGLISSENDVLRLARDNAISRLDSSNAENQRLRGKVAEIERHRSPENDALRLARDGAISRLNLSNAENQRLRGEVAEIERHLVHFQRRITVRIENKLRRIWRFFHPKR
jgi:hypothetical protein